MNATQVLSEIGRRLVQFGITLDPIDAESLEIGWGGQEMDDLLQKWAYRLYDEPEMHANVNRNRLAMACELAARTVNFIAGPAKDARWLCAWELLVATNADDVETELSRLRSEESDVRLRADRHAGFTNEDGSPDFESRYRLETDLVLASVELRGAEKIASLYRSMKGRP